MNDPVRVSFVVPAYNEERCLTPTLAAIKREIIRTGCTAEIIVVDNASTDGTSALAKSIDGVKVVYEPQKGLFHARQAGFLAARGILVANVDADTLVTEGWLIRVLQEFDADPGLVALSGPYHYHDVSNRVHLATQGFYRVGYAFYVMNRFIFKVGSMLQGGNFIVRRTALEQIGGYNPRFSFYGEDTDLARRLLAVGGVKFTFKLPALSSGRRLTEEGMVRIGVRYAMNFIWATFFHRPFTDKWNDIRTTPDDRKI